MLQTGTEHRVLNLFRRFDELTTAVRYSDGVIKEPRCKFARIDVAVAVDGRSQHGTPVVQEVFRKICASAKKADAKWSLGDDHESGLFICSEAMRLLCDGWVPAKQSCAALGYIERVTTDMSNLSAVPVNP